MSTSGQECHDPSSTWILKTRRIAGLEVMLEPGYCYVAFQSALENQVDVTVEIFRMEQLASLNTEPAARIEGLSPDSAEQFMTAFKKQFELGVW